MGTVTDKLHPNQANVHPLATGISVHRWKLEEVTRQCDAYRKTIPADFEPPLSKQRLWTPRDSYGINGL